MDKLYKIQIIATLICAACFSATAVYVGTHVAKAICRTDQINTCVIIVMSSMR